MRLARLAALILLCSLHASSQMPEEQRIYESYRYWLTMQPPSVQQGPDVASKYRDHLRTQGLSGAEVEKQLRIVEAQGARLEVERWNRILTAEKPRFNTNPNAYLVEMANTRTPGTALDVGMGQGRNAIWLAQKGWDVTGFDPAEKAVALAQQLAAKAGVKIKTEVVGSSDFNFGESRWDLILLSYVSFREIKDRVQRSLKPGGILVIEGFHRDATKERSIGGGVVFDTAELPALFPGLRAVRYEEPMAMSDFGLERVRLVRYCGIKP